MSDLKSKLPDMKELMSMGSKLFNGIKHSVQEIVHDYKEKRAESGEVTTENKVAEVAPEEKKEVEK